MKRRPWTHRPSDAVERAPPKFWPGDKVQDASDPDEIAIVEFSRRDGMICLRWPSGRKEWLSESTLQFAPGFAPVRRR